jgi:hypothetical protein
MLSAMVSLSRMLWLNMALNTGDLKQEESGGPLAEQVSK